MSEGVCFLCVYKPSTVYRGHTWLGLQSSDTNSTRHRRPSAAQTGTQTDRYDQAQTQHRNNHERFRTAKPDAHTDTQTHTCNTMFVSMLGGTQTRALHGVQGEGWQDTHLQQLRFMQLQNGECNAEQNLWTGRVWAIRDCNALAPPNSGQAKKKKACAHCTPPPHCCSPLDPQQGEHPTQQW